MGLFGTICNTIGSVAKNIFSMPKMAVEVLAKVGLKPIRHFIDSHFRDKVVPVEGSVLYCDLYWGVEHSGIYVGDGKIANIEVVDFAESEVKICDPYDFTDSSIVSKKIYVSCRDSHAVGDRGVAFGANQHVGDRAFYGLVIKNCHQFSSKCVVDYARSDPSLWDKFMAQWEYFTAWEWEATLRQLKADARKHLGANKWRLWDWDNQAENEPEPDWQAQRDFFRNQALNPQFIAYLRQELADAKAYQQEIADENIPVEIMGKLQAFADDLELISEKYQQIQAFLKCCPEAQLSFNDVQQCPMDFAQLAQVLEKNTKIQELTRKMGRNYVAEIIKKRQKIPQASKSEVHGTHLSADLMRVLPSEWINLNDEDLQMLFYARLLEHNLQSYQLGGTEQTDQEQEEQRDKRTGAVVACLDTSGSMSGQPLLNAKALLFAIANILKREKRSLYVLLFGDSGQLKEFVLHDSAQLSDLMVFLHQNFNGGTDFQTPLKRALDIIGQQKDYQKADVLMLSDGDCSLSESFIKQFIQEKLDLNCMVYSVLCNGSRVEDSFSDEIVVL